MVTKYNKRSRGKSGEVCVLGGKRGTVRATVVKGVAGFELMYGSGQNTFLTFRVPSL